MIRTSVILAALAVASGSAHAAVSFTGSQYSENFDTLPTATVTGAISGTAGTQNAVPGVTAGTWQAAKIGGSGSTATNFIADTGSSNSGAMFSYGAASSTERALGTLASGTNNFGFGVAITNNASDTLTDVTFTFDGEAWRSSTSVQNILSFAWGVSTTAGLNETNFISNASMTLLTNGDIVGPAPVASNGALNPVVVTPYSVTLANINLGVGQTLFLRWTDVNDGGNDAGLAVDNFSFNAVVAPAPGAIALLGLGALVGIRRKR